MAKRVRDPRPGELVYESYKPAMAGRIVDVVGPEDHGGFFHVVRVRWVDGSTSDVSTRMISDFASLIEDHRRKLRTHEATLARLEAMGD